MREQGEYLLSNNLNVTMITRTVISTLKVLSVQSFLQHWRFLFWIEHATVSTDRLTGGVDGSRIHYS